MPSGKEFKSFLVKPEKKKKEGGILSYKYYVLNQLGRKKKRKGKKA